MTSTEPSVQPPDPGPVAWPPPGPVETAVARMLAHALPSGDQDRAALQVHLLGVDGGPPVPAAQAAAAAGQRPSWLRGLLPRVRMVGRHAGPPECLVTGTRLLEDGPVRTLEQARTVLVDTGVSSTGVHPGGLLRAAEVFGPRCRAELVDVGPLVLVAPHGRVALQRVVRAAATTACRRLDVAALEAVADAAGVPASVAGHLLGPWWVTHYDPDGTGWCWRRPTAARQRGLIAATALRLLAVRAYRPEELRRELLAALVRLPPSTRGDLDLSRVAPAPVLVAWLDSTGMLEETGLHESSGAARRRRTLRCPPSVGLRSDLVLAEAVRGAGHPLPTTTLAAALAAAGYAPSTTTQLARYCPVLRRTNRDSYTLR